MKIHLSPCRWLSLLTRRIHTTALLNASKIDRAHGPANRSPVIPESILRWEDDGGPAAEGIEPDPQLDDAGSPRRTVEVVRRLKFDVQVESVTARKYSLHTID